MAMADRDVRQRVDRCISRAIFHRWRMMTILEEHDTVTHKKRESEHQHNHHSPSDILSKNLTTLPRTSCLPPHLPSPPPPPCPSTHPPTNPSPRSSRPASATVSPRPRASPAGGRRAGTSTRPWPTRPASRRGRTGCVSWATRSSLAPATRPRATGPRSPCRSACPRGSGSQGISLSVGFLSPSCLCFVAVASLVGCVRRGTVW